MNTLPIVIQGGMGCYISTPHLANTVSRLGTERMPPGSFLGTVSGVAPERVMAFILQSGDPGEHFRRALCHFPFPRVANMVLREFLIEEGNPHGIAPRGIPVISINPSALFIALSICANFAFVWLAKEGHGNPVSINYLDKIWPHIYAITGAMLAGVDYITMGAGIPLQIPDVIDGIIEGREVKYRIPVHGAHITNYEMSFRPREFLGDKLPLMTRPRFLPIVSSDALALILNKKLNGKIFGFVVEEPTAGGHNAPPRGKFPLNADGEPVYGEKDNVDYRKIADLGLPFWIGGSKASPEMLSWALANGASGIQVGTAFAFCEESGMFPKWKMFGRFLAYIGLLRIKTDSKASPTGFPFKVASMPGSLSDKRVYDARKRACRHGVLVSLYERPDGTIGYRCPSEPVGIYGSKGGKPEETRDRRCICSGLISTAGLGDSGEAPIITLGDDATRLMRCLMKGPFGSYTAADVFKYLEL